MRARLGEAVFLLAFWAFVAAGFTAAPYADALIMEMLGR